MGEVAAERMLLYPDSAASVFKRDMGSKKQFKLLNKTFLAEELSSLVLRVLKEDAQEYLGEEVTEAVISVPAYFDDARRRATKRAGELAGLKVERIISEPTAAAIAYGLYQSQAQARFLVFDLGGGTFFRKIFEKRKGQVFPVPFCLLFPHTKPLEDSRGNILPHAGPGELPQGP